MSHNTLINRPTDAYLQAAKTTGQSIGGSWTKLTFDSPSTNTSGLTVSSSTYTATIAGLYLIHFDHYHVSDTQSAYLGYTKNSGSIPTEQTGVGQPGYVKTFLTFVDLAVGDTLELAGYSIYFGNPSILTIVRLP